MARDYTITIEGLTKLMQDTAYKLSELNKKPRDNWTPDDKANANALRAEVLRLAARIEKKKNDPEQRRLF